MELNERLLLDGTGYFYGDLAIAFLITLSALLTYTRIGFQTGPLRMPFPRMVMGVGFTVWAMRFWYTIWIGVDVPVAPLAMIGIALVCTGYCCVQVYAIRRTLLVERNPVFCLQAPDLRCHREDRLDAVVMKRDAVKKTKED
jgi:hypothetical protein